MIDLMALYPSCLVCGKPNDKPLQEDEYSVHYKACLNCRFGTLRLEKIALRQGEGG